MAATEEEEEEEEEGRGGRREGGWALIWEVARGDMGVVAPMEWVGEGLWSRLALRGAGTGGVSSSTEVDESDDIAFQGSSAFLPSTGLEPTDFDPPEVGVASLEPS